MTGKKSEQIRNLVIDKKISDQIVERGILPEPLREWHKKRSEYLGGVLFDISDPERLEHWREVLRKEKKNV